MNQKLVQEKNEVENIRKRVEMLGKILPKNALITPHMKELSRLTQTSIHKIYEKFIDMLDIYSYNMFLIYILKDTTSVVSNGRLRYFNTSGNDALATGGSGDVLTGIIGGLLAQGINPYEAACLGVYIHGLTAEYYTKQTYSGSMIAGDIVECIGKVMK